MRQSHFYLLAALLIGLSAPVLASPAGPAGMEWLDQPSDQEHQDIDKILDQAQQLYDQKQYAKAMPLYAAIYRQMPDAHDLALQYAYCLFRDHQPKMALTVLNRVALQSRNPALIQQAKEQITAIIKADINAKSYQTDFVTRLQKSNFNVTVDNLVAALKDIVNREEQVYQQHLHFSNEFRQLDDAMEAYKMVKAHSQVISGHLEYLQTQRERLNVYGAKLIKYHHNLAEVTKSLKHSHLSEHFQKQGKQAVDHRLGSLLLTPALAEYQIYMTILQLANADIGKEMQVNADASQAGAISQMRSNSCNQASVGMLMLKSEIGTLKSLGFNPSGYRSKELELNSEYIRQCGNKP